MNASFQLVFNRKKSLSKAGKAPLEYQIYLGSGKRKYFATGYKLTPEQWNDKKKRITAKHKYYIQINAYLNTVLEKLEKTYYKHIANDTEFTFADAQEIIKGNKSPDRFADLAWKIHEDDKASLNENYLRHQKSAINLFISWANNPKLVNINADMIMDFKVFLQKKGMAENTQYAKHRIVRKMLNIAVRKGIIKRNPYEGIPIRKGRATGRNGLDFSDIEKIEKAETKTIEMQFVKDLFLFSCYTGLRFSDIQNLNKTNIQTHEKGITISFVMAKTQRSNGVPVVLPLYNLFQGRPEQIIKKYISKPSHYVFPRITNEHANRQLKLIQLFAGIDQTLSMHIGRHTFCSRLAEVRPDPYLIKQLAGHSDIRTSMIYIHQSKAAIEKKLNNIDWD